MRRGSVTFVSPPVLFSVSGASEHWSVRGEAGVRGVKAGL